MKAIACLWEGHDLPSYSQGKYGPEYVEALAHGLGPDVELICYTDKFHEGYEDVVEWREFKHEHRGGWSKRLEPFAPENRPARGERHVMFDLDTIITGDCSWLWEWDEAPVGCPLDPYFTGEICSTVVSYDEEGAEIVWDAYQASDMQELRFARGCYSEMVLLRALQKQHGWLPLEDEPEKLLSYKVHVPTQGWCDASLVYMHGKPKPHELPEKHKLRNIWSAHQHQA